jgi:hypothetical protein
MGHIFLWCLPMTVSYWVKPKLSSRKQKLSVAGKEVARDTFMDRQADYRTKNVRIKAVVNR